MSQKIKFAVVLAASVFVSMLFLMYAFIQKAEADKQRLQAVRQAEQYKQLEHEYMLTMKSLEDCVRQSEELKDKAVSK